ncbi:MAG: DUF1569 domain-containing protein [Pseudomonadota bacterium]
MIRRGFVKYLTTGAFLGVAGGGWYWLNAPRDQSHLSVDLMLDRLDQLARSPVQTTGTWDGFRTFNHLAQSVEFSIAGYPTQNSALFQATAGTLAFKVFKARGAMSHGLDEMIPGEVVAAEAGDTKAAIGRLSAALQAFRAHEGELKPHFAFGALSKEDFAIAHVLHINNHLEEIAAGQA